VCARQSQPGTAPARFAARQEIPADGGPVPGRRRDGHKTA
jgi:hypothetical protein